GRDRVVIERSEDLVVDHARIGVAPGGDEHLGQPVGVGRGARPQYSAYGLSRPALEVLAEAEAVAPVERLNVLDRAQLRVGRESRALKQRGPRRAAEQPRLSPSCDDGLNRLLGRAELEAVV